MSVLFVHVAMKVEHWQIHYLVLSLLLSLFLKAVFFLQSIGFIGPAVALVGLTTARSPAIASAWLTLAVGLKAFSHCGFLVNLQVSISSSIS